jgi:hypothetical protein
MTRKSVSERIFQEMKQIRYRLDDIESALSKWTPQPLKIPDSKLLSLPDNLRKTYMAVSYRGKCNATEVSILTARCRSIESKNLNQLTRMGWLTRHRDSRTVIFGVIPEEIWKETLQR